MPSVDKRGIVEHVFSVAGLIAVVRVAGFIEEQVLAYFFGASATLDAYFVALSVPMTLFFVVTALVNPTILPMFVRRTYQGDEREAWGQITTFGALFTALLVLAVLSGTLWSDRLATVLAPGFDEATHALCAKLIALLLPSALFLGLVPLTTAVLNAKRRFLVIPMAELVAKGTLVVFLAVFSKTLGINAAVIGFSAGAVGMVALHVIALARRGTLRSAGLRFRDPDFRILSLAMLAPGAGALFSRLGGIVENAACSTLEPGAVTALELARKIVNLPLLIIPFACSTVLFTYFAEYRSRKDPEASARLLGASLRAMVFVFLPLVVLTMLLAAPITAVVFKRGNFDLNATRFTAYALMWLAPSMFFYAVEALLVRYFFSQERFWAPTNIGIGCVALKVALIAAFVGSYGLAAVAGSVVVSRGVKVGLLLYSLRQQATFSAALPELKEVGKIAVATGVAIGAAYVVLQVFGDGPAGDFVDHATRVGLVSTVAGICYIAAAYALGLRDFRYALEKCAWRRG
jgi:putative peptidoglycan lipid II flippase